MMYGHEKWDLVIVAMKRANTAKQACRGGMPPSLCAEI
jgi:hypothetical protein